MIQLPHRVLIDVLNSSGPAPPTLFMLLQLPHRRARDTLLVHVSVYRQLHINGIFEPGGAAGMYGSSRCQPPSRDTAGRLPFLSLWHVKKKIPCLAFLLNRLIGCLTDFRRPTAAKLTPSLYRRATVVILRPCGILNYPYRATKESSCARGCNCEILRQGSRPKTGSPLGTTPVPCTFVNFDRFHALGRGGCKLKLY